MAYAIIQSGGKQYKVTTGEVIDVEKLEVSEGSTATFSDVIFHSEGSSLTFGSPTISGATVTASVVSQHKAKK